MTATDAMLLDRWIASRDAGAFSELVSRHAGLVYGVCRRIVQNAADAEDLAQDCFLKLAAVARAPSVSLGGWLHAVAARGAIDLLRSGRRRRDRERRFAAGRASEAGAGGTWEELRELVDVCLAELPPELREVLVGHFLERRTQEAVATSLGVSRQTVTHRLERGIERLRRLLARRGITIAGAALGATLGGLPVEAAPGTLLASLGKLALAGPPAALAGATASSSAATIATVGGTIVAKKLFISAGVALAVLLIVGSTVFRGLPDRAEWAPRAVVQTPAPAPAGPRHDPPANDGTLQARAIDTGDPTAAIAGQGSRGKVVDADGQPVAGAMVVAASAGAGPAARRAEAVTDALGSFVLESREVDELASRADVAVWSLRRGTGLGTVPLERDGMEIVLRPLASVSGRIYERDTGQGIAGLKVQLACPDLGPPLFAEAWSIFPELHPRSNTIVTQPDGSYVLADLAPLRLFFAFDATDSEYVLPGHRLQDSVPELVLAAGESRSDVDFALERGGSIAGTVLGPDGAGVSGASVEALAPHDVHFPRILHTDAAGAYRFVGLATGATYVITATHKGFAPGESAGIAVAGTEPVEGVDVQLSRGQDVRGRVVDEGGRPAAGIAVHLAKLRDGAGASQRYAGQRTGEDGSFAFVRVAPGTHVLAAMAGEEAAGQPLHITVPADGDLAGLELVLRPAAPGFIDGRVVDETDRPVAGFPVNAMADGRKAGSALSGEDGSFRISNLPEGKPYTVTGYSSEHWSGRQLGVQLYATDVTLVVVRRGRILARVVDDMTGAPIEHFEARAVFIRAEAGDGENRYHTPWSPYDSRTGELAIERAEPVACELQVRAQGYVETRSARFSVPPGATTPEVRVALGRGVAVRGRVVDAATGEPLPGALVRAHQHEDFFPGLLQEGKASYAPRGVWERTMAAPDGSFQLAGLAPGETIGLAVWKEGYGPAIRSGVQVDRAGAALRISLERAAALVVTARFEPHAGERHELVAHHRGERPWRAAFQARAEVSSPGAVELAGLPAGPYRLAVYAVRGQGGASRRRLLGEERLTLTAGERREVPLDFDGLAARFASVSGKVTAGASPGRARLFIVSDEDPEEPYAQGPTAPDPDGRFSFTGLLPGKYAILTADETAGAQGALRIPVQLAERQALELELPAR